MDQADIKVITWYRQSTNQWIGQVDYLSNGIEGSALYTGETENEARNAAFCAIPYLLLQTTFES